MSDFRQDRASHMLEQAERMNLRLGHENLGSLSVKRGFVPLIPPLRSFPETHRVWDDIAADLPELHRTLQLRAVLEQMPVLDAGPSSLPDTALTRAATVLGIVGHAYHSVCCQAPGPLPPAVAAPWAQVRQRLGRRDGEVLSYVDLIVNNWQLLDDNAAEPWDLDNLRLLVSTVDNQEERIFYLTQLQILARSASILPAVAGAQDAVVDDDPEALNHAILRIEGAVRDITRRSLPRINPRAGSATYVDPVTWAKTVAPLAVPIHPGLLGPSGAASPLFNLIDVFLARPRHESQLGREVLRHRASYPPHWRRLLAAVAQVSVPEYVAACGDDGLSERLDALRLAYAGPEGFLERHRRKVFGYVHVGFEVGKLATSGGFTGGLGDQVDRHVDDALGDSRGERVPSEHVWPRTPPRPERAHLTPATKAARPVRVSELVEHNAPERGLWTAVQGRVYDVNALLDQHPGGQQILLAYVGLDATQAFGRVHPNSVGVDRLRLAVEIGRLQHPVLPDHPLPGCGTAIPRLYQLWVEALYLGTRLHNASRLDRTLYRDTALEDDTGRPPSPYLLDRALDTCDRFAHGYLPSFVDGVVVPLIDRTKVGPPSTVNLGGPCDAGSPPPMWRSHSSPAGTGSVLLRGARTSGAFAELVDATRRRLQSIDMGLSALAAAVRQVVACFEGGPDPHVLSATLNSATTNLCAAAFAAGSAFLDHGPGSERGTLEPPGGGHEHSGLPRTAGPGGAPGRGAAAGGSPTPGRSCARGGLAAGGSPAAALPATAVPPN